MQDDIVGAAETSAQVSYPVDHGWGPIDQVIDQQANNPAALRELGELAAVVRQIERLGRYIRPADSTSIVDHGQIRRSRDGAHAQDVASFPPYVALQEVEEPAASSSPTVMDRQDRLAIVTPPQMRRIPVYFIARR
jgi:hypothetical protein